MSAGLDEVGMGSVAGPITVAVAVFSNEMRKIPGLGDSKKLTKKRRQDMAPAIWNAAEFVGIGWVHPNIIDELGKTEAWNRACLDALEGMPRVDVLTVDGIIDVNGYCGKQITMPKADDKVWQVSAASIIAKVVRDIHMQDMAECYSGYGWERNSGYGTAQHMEAIKARGATSYHRLSFLTHPKWGVV